MTSGLGVAVARYGTIIVDLERNAVVDLLPGREVGQVADWLRLHPGIEIITRDRADVYGEGARQGAPNAMQVLDRWHLLRNLSEALQEVVTGHHAVIRTVVGTMRNERITALQTEQAGWRPATVVERRKLWTHAPRHARHAEVVRLHAGGASVARIALHLCMDRKTVFRWLRRDGPPLWLKPPRGSVIDPYRDYLDRRWSEGCRNAAALARELDILGAGINLRVVRAWALARRRAGPNTLDAESAGTARSWTRPSMRGIVRLLQRDPSEIAGEDAAFVVRLRTRAPFQGHATDLAGRLARMLRRRSHEPIRDWPAEACSSPLERFADGLGRDVVSVENAIAMPWSTSPVEDQVNRLKLIKRQMYGRASFELLRRRVLAAA